MQRFCSVVVLIWTFSLLVAESAETKAAERPNVLVVLTDDQGWGDLSLTGNANLDTPHIDSLAAEGASFDRFFVCPVCSPTRAEFLTGRYHPRGGVYSTSAGGERLDLDEMTIAQTFQAAGYRTAAFGKWHNGAQPPYHPNARGFDEFYGFCSGHWGEYFSPMLEHNNEIVRGDGFLIDDFTDHALAFMEESGDEPFFIYLPYNTPHAPMQVPDRWWDRFEHKELEMRNRDPAKEQVPMTRAALAMCENIDWNVGRLLDKLDELGVADETIVVFFCDNGPNSWRWNGDMKGRKGSTDEGGVRSPLLVRWPGTIDGGRTIGGIAAAIDLLPTLADLADVPVVSHKPLDGISLKKSLLDPPGDPSDRRIFSHWRGRVSVRTPRYRLDNKGLLFDLTQDPGQRDDVSDDHPEVARQLRQEVQQWQRELLPGLEDDDRPFPVGHPEFRRTRLPAGDGVAHGGIVRSNKFPNCSYDTNWTSVDDAITWDVDVLAAGAYDVDVYYTCPEADVGSTVELSIGNARIESKVAPAHDPPLIGSEHDRIERWESYVKDFRPLRLGRISLPAGRGTLRLKATEIPGRQVMDMRLLLFTRAED